MVPKHNRKFYAYFLANERENTITLNLKDMKCNFIQILMIFLKKGKKNAKANFLSRYGKCIRVLMTFVISIFRMKKLNAILM